MFFVLFRISRDNELNALYNFKHNYDKINNIIEFQLSHPGIKYIEINSDSTIDLKVLDKDAINQNIVDYKYHFFGEYYQSDKVKEALQYVGYDIQYLNELRRLLSNANCISVEICDKRNTKKYIIGYKRYLLEKWVYIKINDNLDIDIESEMTRCKRNYHTLKLNDKWFLYESPGAI